MPIGMNVGVVYNRRAVAATTSVEPSLGRTTSAGLTLKLLSPPQLVNGSQIILWPQVAQRSVTPPLQPHAVSHTRVAAGAHDHASLLLPGVLARLGVRSVFRVKREHNWPLAFLTRPPLLAVRLICFVVQCKRAR